MNSQACSLFFVQDGLDMRSGGLGNTASASGMVAQSALKVQTSLVLYTIESRHGPIAAHGLGRPLMKPTNIVTRPCFPPEHHSVLAGLYMETVPLNKRVSGIVGWRPIEFNADVFMPYRGTWGDLAGSTAANLAWSSCGTGAVSSRLNSCHHPWNLA